MAEQDILDSAILEAPNIIGFTPVNDRNPLQRSSSKGNEQPAPKRRKRTDRSNLSTLSAASKPKRRSPKLPAKVTKPARNSADTDSSVAPEGRSEASHPDDIRSPRTQDASISNQVPKATIDKLASFRYTGLDTSIEQVYSSHNQGHVMQPLSDNLEIVPPSHQPEYGVQTFFSDTPMSQEDVDDFHGDFGSYEVLEEFFGEDNKKEAVQSSDDPMIASSFFDAAYNPPSEEVVPTQLLGDYTNAEDDVFESSKENDGIGELDDDEEETAALLALADSLSTANPRAQTCTLSLPPTVSIPPTQATISESSLLHLRTASTYSSTAPALHQTQESQTIPPSPISTLSTSSQLNFSQQDPLPSASSLPALSSASPTPKPFVRGTHPSPLNSRSPIPGLSTTPRVLTCFRLGEAINATSRSLRAGHPVQVELYARVLHSARLGDEQHFRFVDLWYNPSKGGLVVEGSWKGWKGVTVWEEDGEGCLTCGASGGEAEKKLCRIVGSVVRRAGGGWRIEVGTCWEVTWTDVENVRSVVCS